MTESTTPSKFAKWKRPLTGGLLSAGIEGIGLATVMAIFGNFASGDFLPLLVTWPINLVNFFSIPFPEILAALLMWFIAGFTIAHFIKNNIWATLSWLLIVLILGPVLTLVVYFMFIFN